MPKRSNTTTAGRRNPTTEREHTRPISITCIFISCHLCPLYLFLPPLPLSYATTTAAPTPPPPRRRPRTTTSAAPTPPPPAGPTPTWPHCCSGSPPAHRPAPAPSSPPVAPACRPRASPASPSRAPLAGGPPAGCCGGLFVVVSLASGDSSFYNPPSHAIPIPRPSNHNDDSLRPQPRDARPREGTPGIGLDRGEHPHLVVRRHEDRAARRAVIVSQVVVCVGDGGARQGVSLLSHANHPSTRTPPPPWR